MTGCRISKVKMKNSPLAYIVPKNRTPFELCCDSVTEWAKQKEAGFVVVAWNDNGNYSVKFNSDGKPVPAMMIGNWIKDIINREISECDAMSRIEEWNSS